MSDTFMQKEKDTVKKMIELYCRENHGGGLCSSCQELLEYAFKRLEMCKFGQEKPTCGKCAVHCYKPEMREKITAVMRYSGPKMLRQHPVEAIRHLIHSMKS